MSFIRTVLGDIAPTDLGITYAHEHLVIDGGRPVELNPDFDLTDLDRMATEVAEATALGLRSVVDAMPCDCGRNVAKLAELSRRTGLHVIAATGIHHARYYPADHWSATDPIDDLAERFIREVTEGVVDGARAGVIKVAGSDGGPSGRDLRIFEAAAQAHRRTGAPILTHCEGGTGAIQQIRILDDLGVPPAHVAVSHVDKIVDRGYHREILGSGAFAEYDGSFRWGDAENGTIQLLRWALEDDAFGGILLGMDAARQGYYHAYGGGPGLSWLLDGFSRDMASHGIDADARRRLFVDDPARAFAFAEIAPT